MKNLKETRSGKGGEETLGVTPVHTFPQLSVLSDLLRRTPDDGTDAKKKTAKVCVYGGWVCMVALVV